MKSLKEYQKQNSIEVIGKYFRLGWVFEKWHEKLIVVILCVFGLWKIFNLFGLF